MKGLSKMCIKKLSRQLPEALSQQELEYAYYAASTEVDLAFEVTVYDGFDLDKDAHK